MPRLTAYQAEKKYQISRMQVGRWIKAGKITADIANEVDENELLVLIKSKGQRAPPSSDPRSNIGTASPLAQKTDKSKPTVIPRASSDDPFRSSGGARSDFTAGDHIRPGADLNVKDKEVSVQTKQVKLAREKIRYLVDVKKVIPVDVVNRSYSMIASALEEQFRMFDEREGEELYAIAKDVPVIEFKKTIKTKIDHAMRSVCAVVEKQNEKLKEGAK